MQAKMTSLWTILCLKRSSVLMKVAAMLGLWGEAILVGHHHNAHHYYHQYILIAVFNRSLVQVGLEGLAEVEGRSGVGAEQKMVQMTREKAGEDKEGGLGQEGVEGLEGEEDREAKSPGVSHLL